MSISLNSHINAAPVKDSTDSTGNQTGATQSSQPVESTAESTMAAESNVQNTQGI